MRRLACANLTEQKSGWQTRGGPSYLNVKVQGLLDAPRSTNHYSMGSVACNYHTICFLLRELAKKIGIGQIFRPKERQRGHESPHFVLAIHMYHSVRQSKRPS